MTAVARPPRGMVKTQGQHAAAGATDVAGTGDYVGRHRREDRARHPHAAAAALAVMLAWIPAAAAGRGAWAPTSSGSPSLQPPEPACQARNPS